MAQKSNTAQLDFGLVILDPEAYRRQQQKKGRRCLSCSRSFASTGPGNRICRKCKDLDGWTTPTDFAIHATF